VPDDRRRVLSVLLAEEKRKIQAINEPPATSASMPNGIAT
jgi:hypothetical protein